MYGGWANAGSVGQYVHYYDYLCPQARPSLYKLFPIRAIWYPFRGGLYLVAMVYGDSL